MELERIEIHNYKSLRQISIDPSRLTVLVGPNASGKSNFCDALDFLGEVYRLGLEVAVARKGGYENICFRRIRRSKAPIQFRIRFKAGPDEVRWPVFTARHHPPRSTDDTLIFTHDFGIRAESTNIQAPFYIDSETVKIHLTPGVPLQGELPFDEEKSTDEKRLLVASREGNKITKFDPSGLLESAKDTQRTRLMHTLFGDFMDDDFEYELSETELLLPLTNRVFLGHSPFKGTLGSLRVFQLSPRNCRESGVPTPNPELSRFGSNLPAVVEFLKTQHKRRYNLLLETVKRVMPTLKDLETQYTHRKTLGLLVAEKGFGRPWAAEDVSDGTIQSIALLVAIFDPRIRIVVVEEPENSIHPWAIRQFIEAAREVSESKHVILTTHSPILIDQLQPSELWVVRRPEAETLLDPVLHLDPKLGKGWGEGEFTLSEYLDSGILPDAVPSEQQ